MQMRELLDRESIRRTLARYTLSGDRGRVDELVACFTAEGVLEFEGEWMARGRESIRTQVAGAGNLTAERSAAVALLRHHLSTQEIELDSDSEARAWTYFTAVTDRGLDHTGRYVDQLSRVGDDWLIRHRRVCVEWWSSDTIYVEQAARARSGAATSG